MFHAKRYTKTIKIKGVMQQSILHQEKAILSLSFFRCGLLGWASWAQVELACKFVNDLITSSDAEGLLLNPTVIVIVSFRVLRLSEMF